MVESRSHFLKLALFLGWQDVWDTYRRSTLGPIWITLGLGIQIVSIGTIFGLVFGTDLGPYFVHLAVSLVLWTLIVGTLNEGTGSFIQAEQIIKQMWIPAFFPVLRTVAKNSVIFLHNALIVAVIMVVFRVEPTFNLLLLLPGVAVLFANLTWLCLVVGIVSARYRDLPPIVASVLLVAFYVTPVLWMPESLPENYRSIVLTFNPFFHLMEIVRAPIIGYPPSLLNWAISLGFFAAGAFFSWWLVGRVAWKVAYWL